MHRLPYVYFSVLVVEAVLLGWRYATDPPAASDPLNVWLGWGGLISMIVMLIYSGARRSRTMRRWARLSYWLHLHIFLGLQGVLMVVFHCLPMVLSGKPIVWLNPGVLNLIAVMIVFFSGLFGRYLYAQLPRTIGGQQMALKQVDQEMAQLEQPMPEAVAALWASPPAGTGFGAIIGADLARRSALRQLTAMNLTPQMRELARRRVRLERQRAMVQVTQRVFRNWITLHRPLAAAMYVLSFIHVALAYMFTPALAQ